MTWKINLLSLSSIGIFCFLLTSGSAVYADDAKQQANSTLTAPAKSSGSDKQPTLEQWDQLIARALSERPLIPAAGYDTPACQVFLSDFERQKNIVYVKPLVVARDYKDSAFRSYFDKCPKLSLRSSLREYVGRPMLSLYVLEEQIGVGNKTEAVLDRFLILDESYFVVRPRQANYEAQIAGESSYLPVDLAACVVMGLPVVGGSLPPYDGLNDGGKIRHRWVPEKIHGVIRHQNITGVYRLILSAPIPGKPDVPDRLSLYQVNDSGFQQVCVYGLKNTSMNAGRVQ